MSEVPDKLVNGIEVELTNRLPLVRRRGEEFTCVGWKCNELLYYWRGTYWRWTRSPMVKDDPPHVFEPLTDEHKEGWNLQ